VRLRDRRIGTAILLLALVGCDEETPVDTWTGNQFGDDAEVPADDDDDDESDEAADAGTSPPRDAGARDASSPLDAANSEGSRDGGRRRDGGASDGSVTANDGGPSADDGAVPTGDVCAPTATWDAAWSAFEDEVLRLTNEARAAGHNCDSEGNFGKAGPLAMESRLRCAARLFSKTLAESGTFSHDGPDGSTVETRLNAAGYTRRSTWGENIAKGQTTPAQVVTGWLDSDGHCANIMNPNFTQIGVGFFSLPSATPKGRPTLLWTQDFAKPR
jgi:uncharacterized protein YkwD